MNWKPLNIGGLIAKVPIVQGGMGVGVSLDRLAGAVAARGGVGVISAAQIGYLEEGYETNPLQTNLKAIDKYIKLAREKANGGIIGINIMVATNYYEEYVKAAVEAGADLIICGAGLPTKLPELTLGSNVRLAPIVSSKRAASVICKMWDKRYKRVPDMVIIEGPLAGGHLGFDYETLERIQPEEFDREVMEIITVAGEYAKKYNRHIPVVVGGGVYDHEDMKHYMDMGADGVQIGTRFVTTVECDASEDYKQTYIRAKKEDIRIVKSPVGMPGRAIDNVFLQKSEAEPFQLKKCYQCLAMCSKKDIPYCICNALVNAAKGNVDDALLFCGANAYRAERIETVEEVMNDLLGGR